MAKVILVNDAPRLRNVLGKLVPPGEHTFDFEDEKLLNATIKDVPDLRIKSKSEKSDEAKAAKAAEEAEKQRLADEAKAAEEKAKADAAAAEAEKQKQLQNKQSETSGGWKQ